MRVGILGGSFDPIHLGHPGAAGEVRTRAGLDRVELVVAASPPHKDGGCAASFEARVAMARLAVHDDPDIGVLDLEGRREGPSYTFYTVTELSRKWPGWRLALLVGADMLADLPTWHRAEELVERVGIIAFARPGFDFEAAERAFRAAFPASRPQRVEITPRDVSSTAIRRSLQSGEDPVGLHPEVADYIRRKGLYLSG